MSKSKTKYNTLLICHLAIFTALEIILNRTLSINTEAFKIGFAFVPVALCAMLYGPGWAAAVAAISDITGALLLPLGPYHPGITLCAVMMALSFGFFLNKRPFYNVGTGNSLVSWSRIRLFPNIIVPTLLNCLIFGLLLNTVWLSMLYGSRTYWGWFVYRIPQYTVLIPVYIIILPILVKFAEKYRKIIV